MKKSVFLMAAMAMACLAGCSKQHANVGLFYCAAESNSKFQVDAMKEELEKKGLTAKLISFSDSNDIASVLNGNIDSVDSIYIPTDNTCAHSTEIIDSILRPAKKPVFAGEEGICEGCGAITLSISYYNLGVKTGEMAVDVLLGKKQIGNLEVAKGNPVKKYNAANVQNLGISVPSDYVELSQEATPETLPEFQNTDNNHYKIGISQAVKHEALDAATKGFKDAVKSGLGATNVVFDEQVAQDQSTIPTAVGKFVTDGVDLILGNATPSLQAACNATQTIPILGTSVTDYASALGLTNFDGVSHRNFSGTSDLVSPADQADMIESVFSSFFKK